MDLNADFTERAVVHAAKLDWIASPMPGVERRMLDRVGDEVARATTIVRYATNSHFSPHVHSGGEEFIVLEGTFQDEHGDYPAGSYVRNPPQSQHTPGSESGCVIFVKLWQFDPDDRTDVKLETNTMPAIAIDGREGVKNVPLFHDQRENVRLELWEPNADIILEPEGGVEILVLAGSFTESSEIFSEQSWLRLPVGAPLAAKAGAEGCRIWVKEGHLRYVNPALPAA